jgi:hypothetical protein
MAAPKGNNYWQFRNKHGRDYKYQPDELWDEFVQYSEWVEKNPLYEQKVFSFQGMISTHEMPKMRAMTVTGFCLFADISYEAFRQYKQNKDFIAITTRIENAIYQQKFEGAAAELLSPAIIARDLGLKDQHDHTTKGEKMQTSITVSATTDEDIVKKLLAKFDEEGDE